MPFGGFKDFADCVARNQDKDDPDAYCGRIKAQVEKRCQIAKVDEDRNLVFGWANVAVRKDGGQVVDFEDDMTDVQALEDAAYLFNLEFREANAGQHGSPVIGKLVESLVVTPEKLEAMGLDKAALPLGWWVGFLVDDATFGKVKKGQFKMFSIEGSALREAA